MVTPLRPFDVLHPAVTQLSDELIEDVNVLLLSHPPEMVSVNIPEWKFIDLFHRHALNVSDEATVNELFKSINVTYKMLGWHIARRTDNNGNKMVSFCW